MNEIIMLIFLTLSNGDVYNKVWQMPTGATHKDCLQAGAQWMSTQKPEDSPQYLCLVKGDTSHADDAAPAPTPSPKSDSDVVPPGAFST